MKNEKGMENKCDTKEHLIKNNRKDYSQELFFTHSRRVFIGDHAAGKCTRITQILKYQNRST